MIYIGVLSLQTSCVHLKQTPKTFLPPLPVTFKRTLSLSGERSNHSQPITTIPRIRNGKRGTGSHHHGPPFFSLSTTLTCAFRISKPPVRTSFHVHDFPLSTFRGLGIPPFHIRQPHLSLIPPSNFSLLSILICSYQKENT